MHLGAWKFLIFILIIYWGIGNIDQQFTLLSRDKADNALIEGTFAGTLCDVHKSFQTIKPIKTATKTTVQYDFEKMIRNSAIFIREDQVFSHVNDVITKNMLLNHMKGNMEDDFHTDEVIIYNRSNQFEKIDFADATTSSMTNYSLLDKIKTPNNIEVQQTSIYVRFSYELTGILGEKYRVARDKYVVLQYD